MNTPVCDFVENYIKNGKARLHMPGHKGSSYLGCEMYDITEIDGADSLYEAKGIIRESELNAGALFGADTFYSTEGSSLCIRAMMYLISLYAKEKGRKNIILAGRNAHKAFLTGTALLDFDIQWLYGGENASYLSCFVTPCELEKVLSVLKEKPIAVYLTSPDYLGNTVDLEGISKVCRKHGVLLAVDNAHGSYLKFLPQSQHPIDLGADICCDSAHKTLPVLTGGAYLHISKSAPSFFKEQAKTAMELFGSTSPSYLLLQSLDKVNLYLSDGYSLKLASFVKKVELLKEDMINRGYTLSGNEPLKITICAKLYGYSGTDFANELRRRKVECEFSDPDFTVLMLTPSMNENDFILLKSALFDIPQKNTEFPEAPVVGRGKQVISVREAVLSESEYLPIEKCNGRILASLSVSCPPAIPVAVCGERIDEETLEIFKYYGIDCCRVVKENK